MSTPVSMDTPPRPAKKHHHHVRTPTDELKETMQHMIDLQYEQQKQYSTQEQDSTTTDSSLQLQTTASRPQPPTTEATASSAGSSSRQPSIPTPHPSVRASSTSSDPDLNVVGSGTLFFASEELSNQSSGLVRPPRPPPTTTTVESTMTAAAAAATTTTTAAAAAASLTSSLTKSTAQHMNLASYGAMDDVDEAPLGGEMISQPSPPPPSPPLQEHDFHYGNPDYHDPFALEHHHPGDDPVHGHSPRRRRHNNNKAAQFCCCLCEPLVHCLKRFWQAESLHRSFCYGAIDGMLTGSGLVATFCGMQLVSTHSSTAVRALVIVFSLAACFADSVCMAIGHIWTTHVVATAQSKERQQARQQFDRSKADAKGQLVDMLLAKGMLKIDAMSLADTLEGYPDLFAGALTGDSLIGEVAVHHTGGDAEDELLIIPQQQQQQPVRGTATFPSYGRLTDHDMEHPDTHAVSVATRESRQESFLMMLGFTIFAVLPSIIFDLACSIGAAAVQDDRVLSSTKDQDSSRVVTIIHPHTLTICLAACVMWVLGVWKSRFLDSNWLVFGIETVLVLLVCIAAAYGVGFVLSLLCLPEYTLEVVGSSKGQAAASHSIHSKSGSM